jgi:beta-phosphoglucomutase
MPKPTAFIFDLNGTMINDMEYHNTAWYDILNEDLHAGLTREEVKQQMYGKNEELLDRVFGKGYFSRQQMEAISLKKEQRYQEAFRPHLQLIAGLPEFLRKTEEHHIRMAIGSAAVPFNIDYILDNLSIRHYFTAIVSASDVAISKPHPETFLKAAALLQAAAVAATPQAAAPQAAAAATPRAAGAAPITPASCIVFEDAPKGVEAALHAGMRCVVLTTMRDKEEFSVYPNVVNYIADYTDPSLEELFI